MRGVPCAAAIVLCGVVGEGIAHPGAPGRVLAADTGLALHGNVEPAGGDARLSVTIIDEALEKPTAARVRITGDDGLPLGFAGGAAKLAAPGTVLGLPPEAIGVLYGNDDTAEGYAFQEDGSFYVSGSFAMPVPAGRYQMAISKGCEYIREKILVELAPGAREERTVRLRRWIDMPARGWHSADDHIHLRRSPRENPLILTWLAAEDVDVGLMLQMGDFWTTWFPQYAWGADGVYQVGKRILSSGQEEPRTFELGHTISFGADQFVRFQDDYYAFDRVFDQVHAHGGLAGYAHQGMSFHGYRGMTLDVPAGKVDFLELMQFCVPEGPLAVQHYYRFLDLGYRLTATAGSDFPWCGRGRRPNEEKVGAQIGNARFYTYTGDAFDFDRWLQAVREGHTFATTGPMLEFKVEGRLPGDSIDVAPGTRVRMKATAWGHAPDIPLKDLQIIGHGGVLAEAHADAQGQSADRISLEFEFVPQHGIWLAARADAGLVDCAHTTPVYLTVAGDGFHNPERLEERIAASKGYLQELSDVIHGKAPAGDRPRYRRAPLPAEYPGAVARLDERIAEAERELDRLRGLR